MISKTCKYAIRAVIYVAQKSKNGTKIGIKDIASGIDSPEHFIAKILQDLSRKGHIQSSKGPNGGFYMNTHNLEMSIADIIVAVDGDHLFKECALGLKECSESHPCPIHHEFKHIRQEIKDTFEKYKIRMFVDDLDLNLTFLKTFLKK